MALTDREAADLRATRTVDSARENLVQALAANAHRHETPALAFRNELGPAALGLTGDLIAIYAGLNASDAAHRDEILTAIHARVIAFLDSSVVAHAATLPSVAMRLRAELTAWLSTRLAIDFDLELHRRARHSE